MAEFTSADLDTATKIYNDAVHKGRSVPEAFAVGFRVRAEAIEPERARALIEAAAGGSNYARAVVDAIAYGRTPADALADALLAMIADHDRLVRLVTEIHAQQTFPVVKVEPAPAGADRTQALCAAIYGARTVERRDVFPSNDSVSMGVACWRAIVDACNALKGGA